MTTTFDHILVNSDKQNVAPYQFCHTVLKINYAKDITEIIPKIQGIETLRIFWRKTFLGKIVNHIGGCDFFSGIR